MELLASAPARLGTTLEPGGITETVTVTATQNNITEKSISSLEINARQVQQLQLLAPSQNVASLQRRVSGVFPVKIDVPRAGRSYKFVRPLVMDEETRVTFQYKAR